MSTISWVGTTLVLSNRTCTGPCSTLPAGAYNNGYTYTFTAGPRYRPLSGCSARHLGVMGLMRRQ